MATATEDASKGGPGPAAIGKYVAPRALVLVPLGRAGHLGRRRLAARQGLRRRLHAGHDDRRRQLLSPQASASAPGSAPSCCSTSGASSGRTRRRCSGLKPATDEEKAKARKVALYASRTNFILSFPMLLCMAGALARPAVLKSRDLILLAKVPNDVISRQVATALAEDIGAGDVTAALVPEHQQVRAQIIAREPAMLCGTDWVEATFRQLDPAIRLEWLAHDGERIVAEPARCSSSRARRAPSSPANARALNFLQTLSATATAASRYVRAVAGTGCRILDTRKTLPGPAPRAEVRRALRRRAEPPPRPLRHGAHQGKPHHRRGLHRHARSRRRAGPSPGIPVEVEVESLEEFDQALAGRRRHHHARRTQPRRHARGRGAQSRP